MRNFFSAFSKAALGLALCMSGPGFSAEYRGAQVQAKVAGSAGLQSRFAPVRAMIEVALQKQQAPSITVAVARDGKIIWEEGFGLADRERGMPATAHTPYSIASVTKPITATAVMMLNDAGKLDLDAPVEDYLGPIKLTGHAGPTREVTARRIMSHSAGLPGFGDFYLNGAQPAGAEQTISRYGLVVFPPGSLFEYSNIGMKVLDTAVSQVSGLSFGEYLRQKIFLPLGMTRSGLDHHPSWTNEAAARYDAGKRLPSYRTSHPGSGDVWTSAHDLARFMMFHMGTPLAGQRQILSRTKVREMQRPVRTVPDIFGGGSIGANWYISNDRGHPHIYHTGRQPGVSAIAGFYPNQKLAVVVLANGPAPVGEISEAIVRAIAPEVLKEPQAASPYAKPVPVPVSGKWKGTVTSYEGTTPLALEFQPDGDIHLRLGNGPASLLERNPYESDSLAGRFHGTMKLGDLGTYRHELSMKVVPVGDELVGQLNAVIVGNPEILRVLPSFVRLRRTESAPQR